MATFVLDRFEGDYAVLEDEKGAMQNVKRALLPHGLKEGDVLREENGDYTFDEPATRERSERIRRLTDGLFQ